MRSEAHLRARELGIVCDDPETVRVLCTLLGEEPARVTRLSTPRELLASEGLAKLALVLYDCAGSPEEALELLRELRRRDLARPRVVILSDAPSVRWAVEAMKEGAADYLVKPVRAEDVTGHVQRIAMDRPCGRVSECESGPDPPGSAPFADPDRTTVVGRSAAWRDLLERARRVAPLSSTVLLRGETGTGKEILARYIASYGPRATRPFVAVNCAALPENLVESELFGHARGAFTGATSAHRGVFEEAHTGTLLLDEVGSLTMSAQGKLLRVLEDRQVRHVGETRSSPVDVRVLAATNLDMEAAVSRHEFREDLYYRLNVVTLVLPPLRERPDDIPLLARQFLASLTEGSRPIRLSSEAAGLLCSYPFPGNVRELRHAIEQAIAFCDGDELRLADLTFLKLRADLVLRREESRREEIAPVTPGSIREALQRTGDNRAEAARLLGISRSTLFRHLRQLPPEGSER